MTKLRELKVAHDAANAAADDAWNAADTATCEAACVAAWTAYQAELNIVIKQGTNQ